MNNDLPGHQALPIVASEEQPSTTRDNPSVLDRSVSLSELLDVDSFREVCASFVDLYKIGMKVFDADGTKLVDIRVGNGDWCGYIFQNPTGRQKCTGLVSKIKQFNYPGLAEGSVVEQQCFSGLKYVVMPIAYGSDILGRVIYGPFMPATLQKPLDEVFRFEGFDPTRLWDYGTPIRRAPDEMIIKILVNFRSVVETITFVAMKALMTQQLHVASITSSYNELSESNRQLRDSLERLQELDRLKSNFLAMISHELRTPLTSVIGYSEMLLEGMAGELQDEQREYISTIREKGESLLELIGSLLDMSKIEAGAMQLSPTEISVPELLEGAKSYIVPQARKQSIKIEIEVDENLPALRADREKVRQCLVNLLGNAVKFTPENGRISMFARRWDGPREEVADEGRFGPPDEAFVRIDVEDTGIGIPEDKLRSVFDSFYQVDNSVTREYGGTGLGLAIVKRFVEAHKGEVRVSSGNGHDGKSGTRFSLLFPLDVPGAGPVQPV